MARNGPHAMSDLSPRPDSDIVCEPLTRSLRGYRGLACRSGGRVLKPVPVATVDQKITRLRLSRVSESPQQYPHRMPV